MISCQWTSEIWVWWRNLGLLYSFQSSNSYFGLLFYGFKCFCIRVTYLVINGHYTRGSLFSNRYTRGYAFRNEWVYRILNTRGSLFSNRYTRGCAFHNEWVYRILNTRGSLFSNWYTRSCAFRSEWGYRMLNTRGSLFSNRYRRGCAFIVINGRIRFLIHGVPYLVRN